MSSAKWPGLTVVGLTGGIASGKSTVSEMLSKLGAVVIDADLLSREVTAPGTEGLNRVRQAFGDGLILPDGTLDRHRLSAIIFHDEDARDRLNSIVHPLVIAMTEERLRELQAEAGKTGKPVVVVVDAPLLFEAGVDSLCDEVWVVAVSRKTQAERLMKREGYTLEEALTRIDTQMPQEEKERRATKVIDNEGTVEETRTVVESLLRLRTRKP